MDFNTDQDNCFLGLSKPVTYNQPLDCVLVPVPYESTMSFQTGSKESPGSIIMSSYQLEDYDWELDIDLSSYSIATTNPVEITIDGPQAMINQIELSIHSLLEKHEVKLVGLIGGEHSISVGAAKALKTHNKDMSVLYLDAHADLRDSYMGSSWGHACGARRISEFTDITLGGIRSISSEEVDYAKQKGIPVSFWNGQTSSDVFIDKLLSTLNRDVYLSLDLDVLDPHIVGNVGNPEPGGLDWNILMNLIYRLISKHNLVGFDICELVPVPGNYLGSYAAAKIIYKIMADYIYINTLTSSN